MERRFERIETRFEVVWAADGLDGVGILEEERDTTVAEGEVVRRSSLGFAVQFHPASSSEVGRLLDRLVEADPLG